MKVKINSDSVCDLSPELVEKYGLDIVPLYVVKGGVDHRDGLEITPDDIYEHVAAGGDLCSTSAVSVGEYEEYFEKFCPAYDGVLLINIGSGFSSCHQNALVAAEDYENIRCIDSESLSAAQGLLVLEACRMAETAESIDALADAVKAMIPKVEGSFVREAALSVDDGFEYTYADVFMNEEDGYYHVGN